MKALARTAGGAVVPAVLIGGALWFFGVTWPFAVAAAALFLAGTLAWLAHTGAALPLYPEADADPRPGTRFELVQTAWSLRGRHGEITDAGLKRLRGFARRRLARRGWDLDDPADAGAVRGALGDRAWTTLMRNDGVRLSDVEHCLSMLESLPKTGEHSS
ncbi:hypothetical protein [Microbacterium protaetiae]|uniref:hypothetical protein n=1 Tax=Microbacterium protaetiae TaxID=2509458 RepID=UPI001F5CAF2A|nr:hypothetical protein [Microbacterium protaetiae]